MTNVLCRSRKTMHSIRLQVVQVHDGPQLTTFLEYKYFYVFLEVQNISLKELLCLDIQFAKLPLYNDEDLDLSWMK